MKVVYTAPNRSHHYKYALILHEAGILEKFVSGFSRFSPRSGLPEIGNKLVRADVMQNMYLATLRLGFPKTIVDKFIFWAKVEQDRRSRMVLDNADIFMFYSGCGLDSCNFYKNEGIITVVEAVNSHVDYQEELLKEECLSSGLSPQPFYKKDKERRMCEYEIADYILLPSNFVKNSFLKYGFPEEKLIKVPYGFNNLFEGSKLIVKEDTFTVLYVGSISIRKGLRYLIEAFSQWKYKNKKLVIVGPKAKITGIEKVSIPEGVTFTGVLKGELLEKAYKNADVFCLPSIEEGLALVLGEALSYGVPIIATENSGASDIIEDGREGFIIPIRDAKAIKERLEKLADDFCLYTEMKKNSVRKARILNGWEQTGELLVDSLAKLKKRR